MYEDPHHALLAANMLRMSEEIGQLKRMINEDNLKKQVA
jgi:hypothetical protein